MLDIYLYKRFAWILSFLVICFLYNLHWSVLRHVCLTKSSLWSLYLERGWGSLKGQPTTIVTINQLSSNLKVLALVRYESKVLFDIIQEK